ncbi:MAG: hypothetical protein ACQESG_06320 [Nanobdellota archaeon]
MELPIRIILVLLVALIVGMSFLAFSRGVLTSSQEQLEQFGADEDTMLHMESITAREMSYLLENCYTKREAIRTSCMAVVLDSDTTPAKGDVETQWSNLGYNASTLNVSGYNAGKTIFFIFSGKDAVELVAG